MKYKKISFVLITIFFVSSLYCSFIKKSTQEIDSKKIDPKKIDSKSGSKNKCQDQIIDVLQHSPEIYRVLADVQESGMSLLQDFFEGNHSNNYFGTASKEELHECTQQLTTLVKQLDDIKATFKKLKVVLQKLEQPVIKKT